MTTGLLWMMNVCVFILVPETFITVRWSLCGLCRSETAVISVFYHCGTTFSGSCHQSSAVFNNFMSLMCLATGQSITLHPSLSWEWTWLKFMLWRTSSRYICLEMFWRNLPYMVLNLAEIARYALWCIGPTVFRGPRNFEPSRGICQADSRNLPFATEF